MRDLFGKNPKVQGPAQRHYKSRLYGRVILLHLFDFFLYVAQTLGVVALTVVVHAAPVVFPVVVGVDNIYNGNEQQTISGQKVVQDIYKRKEKGK